MVPIGRKKRKSSPNCQDWTCKSSLSQSRSLPCIRESSCCHLLQLECVDYAHTTSGMYDIIRESEWIVRHRIQASERAGVCMYWRPRQWKFSGSNLGSNPSPLSQMFMSATLRLRSSGMDMLCLGQLGSQIAFPLLFYNYCIREKRPSFPGHNHGQLFVVIEMMSTQGNPRVEKPNSREIQVSYM